MSSIHFLFVLLSWLLLTTNAFQMASPRDPRHHSFSSKSISATMQENTPLATGQQVLEGMKQLRTEANEYADMFGLSAAESAVYAYFVSLRKGNVPLGLKGTPFVLRKEEIEEVFGQETGLDGFFTLQDLKKACEDDFLDAARGSTDNRKGWQITDVSVPRGDSFEEARMTFPDVEAALEKGTVIFNAAGAHIPKLAGPSLACTDATFLPCALNLYVTAAGKRTSAPPHTDKQDVAVFQTSGRKAWKVFSPPDPAMKPSADIFARGKMEDNLPLYALEKDLGCELLIETILKPGDVLFVPAAFPHTTGTVVDESLVNQDTSIHLTLGIDHHIWELDYVSTRRLALRRGNIKDTALGQTSDEENQFVGKVNLLSDPLRQDILGELPLGLLDEEVHSSLIDQTTDTLQAISFAVDETTASATDASIWRETVERVRQQGVELLNVHRDMYLAALEEGRTRAAEEAITAHLSSTTPVMTPERIQRLSVFRVKRFFDAINESKKSLLQWSYAGIFSGNDSEGNAALPDDWPFSMPVKVGDQVEADLGGAFFPATVTRASGGSFDVSFFDGDRETNLSREQIKLVSPPSQTGDSEIDGSKLTRKELKRLQQKEKKKSKN